MTAKIYIGYCPETSEIIYGVSILAKSPKKEPRDKLEVNDDAYRLAFELVYFGQRGLTRNSDQYLGKMDIGRAHMRVMFMLRTTPGMTTNEILERLQIVSQSFTRTMRALLEKGYVKQVNDKQDRRLRRHYLTKAGEKIEAHVVALQTENLKEAFLKSGNTLVTDFYRVLFHLSDETIQQRVENRLNEIL